jgi:hypothetical protein
VLFSCRYCGVLSWRLQDQRTRTKKPNILVIMGDDIGVVQPQLRPASFNVDEVMRKLAPKD